MDIQESEISDVEEKLTKIIDFVDQLQSIDTDEIEPMAHPLSQTQRLRADKVAEENNRDKIQKNTKSVERGMYIVPKVIE
jgi:aspartyl-tRNA(Asn)/glutamyl-tRNA(Gln) amidotransferase subunit C